MKVTVMKRGENTSRIQTRARTAAPAAAKVLAEMLSGQDWADEAVIMLDWSGLIAFTDEAGVVHRPEGVLDTPTPVMYTQVIKSMPQWGQTLKVENRLDIDDLMGKDNLEGMDLRNIVLDLRDAVAEALSAKAQEA